MPRARAVVITDAEERSVVAACRGLRGAGFGIGAAAGRRPAPGHWSRSVSERLSVPHPLVNPAAFVDGLEEVVSGGRYDVLMAGSDASLLAISERREQLEPHVRIGLPPHPAVEGSLDKPTLMDAAGSCGLPVPATAVCESAAAALEAAGRFGFPVVLKPRNSVVERGTRGRRLAAARVDDPATLESLVPTYGLPCLVQRIEPGAVVSFAGVRTGDGLLGIAVSRYLRTWLPTAGNASFSETIDPAPGLPEQVDALLGALGFEGLFEVELIERPDGTHVPIDLNPRVYGSLALAIHAGANLPALWCRHLLGERVEPQTARAGLRYRWEEGDLRHLLWQLTHGHPQRALAAARPRRRVVHPHARLSDPAPIAARGLEVLLRGRSRRPRVAVVGAGPYGLAAAAHLREAGVPVHVLGEPLEFWRDHMPEGMILRSRRRSTNISDPRRAFGIERYEQATGRSLSAPSLRLEEFVDYALWFQQKAVPDVDTRKVASVRRDDGEFALDLDGGEELRVDSVVVAAGLLPFPNRPEPFASLPADLVSHSSEHPDLGVFAGRRVAVVGSGQSALESAALLAEGGAQVEILARAPGIYWLGVEGRNPPPKPGLRSRLPLPPTDVGGFATGWAAAVPDVYRHVPERLKPVVSYRCIRPAASGWLRARLDGVPIELESSVVAAEADGGEVRLRLADGSERAADHVLLGTGYAVDVRRYPFLDRDLAAAVETENGYPVLGAGLESSVPGLHFLGAPAALSFGPVMRFVVGTWYAAPAAARRVLGRRQAPFRRSF